MSKSNLLVELFVEELPPKALKKLGDAFASVIFESLKSQGLAETNAVVTAYASPRRLAAHITDIVAKAADKAVSQKLMPVTVGLDADGNPTQALLKRLAALGLDAAAVQNLKRAPDGKADALFVDITQVGATLLAGLQSAIEEALAKLPIPKVMTYQINDGWETVRFVRPAHGLVALHGENIVPVSVLGLSAGNTTQGHRFEASVTPLTLKNADTYAEQLAEEGAVIAGFDARKAEIARQLGAAAQQQGLQPISDDALLDEVTALVERPNVLLGQFEADFLSVPQECLILTMKANQKYFPLLDATGKLTNKFLIVSNINPADASAVIGGNERVVRPRLADAKFFFDQDKKKTLESRVASLDKVVYHNKLGSQGARNQRVRAIAKAIAEQIGDARLVASADKAAQLSKADLLTDMVGEFPELQGIMGNYYARNDGFDGVIADAIEDHYKPRFAGDELPRNQTGLVVALADKLETLAGLFSIGERPTGDKDPFALRRHALGIIRLVIENQLPLDANTLVNLAFSAFETNASAELLTFTADRLTSYCRDLGYSAAEVDAVVGSGNWVGLADVPKRLAAVRAFSALPEAESLAAANKRVGNILKKSESDITARIDTALLTEAAEKSLASALHEIKPKADAAFEAGDYAASLQSLAALKTPVDDFFDHVMVNAEDPALRNNRLGMLATLHQAMNRVADISRLAS